MKNNEALYVLASLGEDDPLIQSILKQHFPEAKTLSPAQQLWYVNRDPALVYHLVLTYFQANKKIPSHIGWPAARRLHRCLEAPVETRRTDPVCHQVLAFGHPTNLQDQARLKGHLSSGLTYSQVALRVGKSEEFVTLYAELFFDFPERRVSDDFVQGVLDPNAERGPFQTDLAELVKIADPTLRLTNVGYWHGPEMLDVVVGQPYDPQKASDESQLLKAVQRRLLTGAHLKAIRDELGIKDAEFGIVKELTKQRKQMSVSNSWLTPLEQFGLSKGILSTLEAIVDEQVQEQSQSADLGIGNGPAQQSNTSER